MAKPRVKVEEGELEGQILITLEDKKCYSFKGIPYAEPPVGDLRFKAPVEKKAWSGVYDATKDRGICAQLDFLTNSFSGSDDCLYLSVNSPRLPQDGGEEKSLPVIVSIHGGGFIMGAGSPDQCIYYSSPDFIVAKDIVMVSINYRLGVLGFLCLDTPDVPGNAGLKDQNNAIKWVKKNIAVFGGDPNNITIIGGSAGAAAVEYQLISPMSKDLFHKAIMESGSTLNPWARTRNPLKVANILSEKLEINSFNAGKMLKGLQESDVEKLVRAATHDCNTEEKLTEGELFIFTPVVEKTFSGVEPFLNEEPYKLLSSGNFMRIPTISGFCASEGGIRVMYGQDVDNLLEGKFIDYIPSCYGIDRETFDGKLRKTYDSTKGLKAVDNFISDLQFIGGIVEALTLRVKYSSGNYYMYMFNYSGGLNMSKLLMDIKSPEAQHGDTLFYLGSNPIVKDVVPSEKDSLTRLRMVQMWTDFAKYGNPTPETSSIVPTKWTPANGGQDLVLMDIGQDLEMKEIPYKERMELWKAIYNCFTEN